MYGTNNYMTYCSGRITTRENSTTSEKTNQGSMLITHFYAYILIQCDIINIVPRNSLNNFIANF